MNSKSVGFRVASAKGVKFLSPNPLQLTVVAAQMWLGRIRQV